MVSDNSNRHSTSDFVDQDLRILNCNKTFNKVYKPVEDNLHAISVQADMHESAFCSKTSDECMQDYATNKNCNKFRKVPKSAAQRNREYRQRKKALHNLVFNGEYTSESTMSDLLDQDVHNVNHISLNGQHDIDHISNQLCDNLRFISVQVDMQDSSLHQTKANTIRNPPKTAAQRNREYRERKKSLHNLLIKQESASESTTSELLDQDVYNLNHVALNGQHRDIDHISNQLCDNLQSFSVQVDLNDCSTLRKPKTSAERTREYRARKKANITRKPAKTAAQRNREYRERKKVLKNLKIKQEWKTTESSRNIIEQYQSISGQFNEDIGVINDNYETVWFDNRIKSNIGPMKTEQITVEVNVPELLTWSGDDLISNRSNEEEESSNTYKQLTDEWNSYDDVDLICLGYARTIKKFSKNRQAIIKLKISRLLREELAQEDENNGDNYSQCAQLLP